MGPHTQDNNFATRANCLARVHQQEKLIDSLKRFKKNICNNNNNTNNNKKNRPVYRLYRLCSCGSHDCEVPRKNYKHKRGSWRVSEKGSTEAVKGHHRRCIQAYTFCSRVSVGNRPIVPQWTPGCDYIIICARVCIAMSTVCPLRNKK